MEKFKELDKRQVHEVETDILNNWKKEDILNSSKSGNPISFICPRLTILVVLLLAEPVIVKSSGLTGNCTILSLYFANRLNILSLLYNV